jgi:hypothetical protein
MDGNNMNHISFSGAYLDEILKRLFVAISKNKRRLALRYYEIAKAEIFRIRATNLFNAEEEEWSANLDHIINVVQEADDIIFHVNDHHDAALVRKAVGLYNQALQEDKLNIRELSSLLAKRVKKASDILSDMLSESSLVEVYEKPKKVVNRIQFATQAPLTPDYLISEIGPWIKATVDLQIVINDFQNREKEDIRVLSITQRSPINVTISAAAEAILAIIQIIVPWRRRHAQKLAEIEVQSRLLGLELQKAEVVEKRALASKAHHESNLSYEVSRRRKFENDLLFERLCREPTLEIAKNTLQLAREEDIEIAVEKMLPAVTTLATSNLDISKTDLGHDKKTP